MTPGRIWALTGGLSVATITSTVAPTHPVYNPPVCKFLLGTMAVTAAMWAREAARWRPLATRDNFVVSFDDRIISLLHPDGTTDAVRFDELERISIEPYENPYLDWWIGLFFVVMHARGRRLPIPAHSTGMKAFLGRLRALPDIDRDALDVLLSGGEPSPCVLWSRETGV